MPWYELSVIPRATSKDEETVGERFFAKCLENARAISRDRAQSYSRAQASKKIRVFVLHEVDPGFKQVDAFLDGEFICDPIGGEWS